MEFEQKRWRYLIAAMIFALCSGIGYAWSVFQKPLMENFDWALETISITFTVQVLTSTIAPVFLSRFQKVFGVKKYLRIGMVVYFGGIAATSFTNSISYLYIVYGLIVGLGLAMLYPTLMAYATGLFPDRTGMASGLLAGAYGSGAILWAPIATKIMSGSGGVLQSFLVLAGIFAVVMIPISYFIVNIPEGYIPKPDKTTSKASNSIGGLVKDHTWQEMLKTPTYYILLLTLTLGACAGLMIAGHASGMVQEILSYTPEQAAILVGLFSVFNAFGRLFFGFASDKLGRYNVFLILFAVIGGCMVVLYDTAAGTVFVPALLAISACYGGFTSMFSPVCADNFGLKNLGVNYAFLYIAYGLAGFVGPQLAARIHHISGGYAMAFLFVAGMAVIGIALTLILKMRAEALPSNQVIRSES